MILHWVGDEQFTIMIRIQGKSTRNTRTPTKVDRMSRKNWSKIEQKALKTRYSSFDQYLRTSIASL